MIRTVRESKNMTQSELAKKMEISQGYLSRIERKDKGIQIRVLLILKLSKELDICHLKVFSFFQKLAPFAT